MDEKFLLKTEIAQRLYHECAERLPIIDYHNHLSPSHIFGGYRFQNLAELWIKSDPYKHRAMRICGVGEELITGRADDFEKFKAWCGIFSQLMGNPLYHWSQMELDRVFGITLPICAENAEAIWKEANCLLQTQEGYADGILSNFNIEYAAPCMQMTEDVSVFENSGMFSPSLRGDELNQATAEFVSRLAEAAQMKIGTLSDLKRAVARRYEEFHRVGCRFSDHALDDGFVYYADDGENERRFKALLQNGSLKQEDMRRLSCELLRAAGAECAKRGWVMQLHIGALRYTSSRLRSIGGAAGGFAGIGGCAASAVTQLLDDMEKSDAGLPRILLFTLNPSDNAAMSVLSGSFSEDGVRAKVQQGPAWWWCDHYYGMRGVFESISAFGVLSAFIGMTTDSRSMLSFVRHEYFRRVFCGWLGEKVQSGEFPNDYNALAELVQKVCYQNAKDILTR